MVTCYWCSSQDAVDRIESAIESAATEFENSEIERGYMEAWEGTKGMISPTHPARFKVYNYCESQCTFDDCDIESVQGKITDGNCAHILSVLS